MTAAPPEDAGWTGRWVADRLGVSVSTRAGRAGWTVQGLVGLALRRNPRRAHLLVSGVLGKHVPVDPLLARAAFAELGAAAGEVLGGDAAGALVLGYAETATGLGHAVADALEADVLHSTRREVPGLPPLGAFEEAHSHATGHLLLPDDPALVTAARPLVLVDDELSTGRTALATIAALQAVAPRRRYVLAALVDVRPAADRAAAAVAAERLGVRLDVVALAAGDVVLPPGLPAAAQRLVDAVPPPRAGEGRGGAVLTAVPPWPAGLREGARHGVRAAGRPRFAAAVREAAAWLLPELLATERGAAPARLLVLGTEELMHLPLELAAALAELAGPALEVRFSSSTRSPVVAVDDPGYAVRTALAFPTPEGTRFAYNVAPPAGQAPPDVVLVVTDDADGAAGLAAAVAAVVPRVVVAPVPAWAPAPAEPVAAAR